MWRETCECICITKNIFRGCKLPLFAWREMIYGNERSWDYFSPLFLHSAIVERSVEFLQQCNQAPLQGCATGSGSDGEGNQFLGCPHNQAENSDQACIISCLDAVQKGLHPSSQYQFEFHRKCWQEKGLDQYSAFVRESKNQTNWILIS